MIVEENLSPVTAPKKTPTEPPRPATQTSASVINLAGRNLSEPRPRQDTPPPSGFAAHIDGASMADLIQLECTRGSTRAVRVAAGDKTGFLYFDRGELVHAIAGGRVGEPAAREILKWETGTVRPSDSYWSKPPTIHMSWQALLISTAQEVDESSHSESETYLRLEVDFEEEEEMEPPQDDGIIRLVELTPEGTIVKSQGDVEGFADAAAYCVQLARLIGEGLGLEDFTGLECTSSEKTMLVYEGEGTTIALEAKDEKALEPHRSKAGL